MSLVVQIQVFLVFLKRHYIITIEFLIVNIKWIALSIFA